MDFLSLTFIAIIILFIILGIYKGFAASVIDFLGNILVLIFALLLTDVISPHIASLSMFDGLKSNVMNSLTNFNPLFGEFFYKDNPEAINQAVQSLNIPSLISPTITNELIKIIPEEGIIIGEAIASLVVSIVASIFCFIMLFIILKLSLFLIKKVFKNVINSIKPIRKIDRLLGSILGLFIGIIAVNIICLVLTLSMSIQSFEGFNNFIADQMQLNTSTWTFSKFMYQNNLLLLIMAWII